MFWHNFGKFTLLTVGKWTRRQATTKNCELTIKIAHPKSLCSRTRSEPSDCLYPHYFSKNISWDKSCAKAPNCLNGTLGFSSLAKSAEPIKPVYYSRRLTTEAKPRAQLDRSSKPFPSLLLVMQMNTRSKSALSEQSSTKKFENLRDFRTPYTACQGITRHWEEFRHSV